MRRETEGLLRCCGLTLGFVWGMQMGFYMDWIGPTILCALVITVLTTITVVALVDVFSYH